MNRRVISNIQKGARSLSARSLSVSSRNAYLSNSRICLASTRNLGRNILLDFNQLRFHSTNDKDNTLKVDDPQLMIAFTCKKCDTRSSHTFSKQSYTKGTVLIQCPGCKNRHLIADNLNIFKDQKFSLEDVLKAKGESVATTTDDLAFNDIPDSLKKTLGHYAKDAPEEYTKENNHDNGLPEGNEKK